MLDTLLDKSVVGYTALGYRWRPHPPIEVDLQGRTALVTGATSGLGLAAARELVRLGAEVTLVGRNPEKTRSVAETIRRETSNARVRFELADLSSMQEVRSLAARIEAPLHLLVNNAGVLLPERTETDEGFEMTFATNLLGSRHRLGKVAPANCHDLVSRPASKHANGSPHFARSDYRKNRR